MAGNKLLSGKIEFIQYHKPGLMAGNYEFTVSQRVDAQDKNPDQEPFGNARRFTVAGPRFQLMPQDIYAVFPPPGSLGEHSNVLPHVIFNRSTLPWEREIWSDLGSSPETGAGSSAPWLALLVFHQDDIERGRVSQPKVVKLSDIVKLEEKGNAKGPWRLDEQLKDSDVGEHSTAIPGITIGPDQNPDDKVTVIDVERVLLEEILPTPGDLDYLAHVRQRKTLSVDVDKKYKDVLTNCASKETKVANQVFANGNYAAFRDSLKQGGIRLSPATLCSITSRMNGNKQEWVLTNTDNKNQFVARKDKGKDAEGKEIDVLNIFSSDAEVAIVVANRLPMKNGLTTVHLVSLEDRYDSAKKEFQYGADAEFARLVSLKQWSFACSRPERTFKKTIKALDKDSLRLNLGNARPEHAGNLAKGYVPLRHYMRKGDKTVSWYHSPLLPWRNTDRLYGLERVNGGNANIDATDAAEGSEHSHSSCRHGGWMFDDGGQYWVEHEETKLSKYKVTPCFGKNPRVSDQLLRRDQQSGIFDTTYAAAWKLGRLMALEDKRFSVALTDWKRSCAQHAHQVEQACCDSHLCCEDHPELVAAIAPPPAEVSTWFDQRNLLKGIPFNYLVPDSRMLPAESIRFFQSDPLWIDCLLDGAFSLGRVTQLDQTQDFKHIIAQNRYPRMSGMLIRSEAVSGWPGMLVDAFYKLPTDVEIFGEDSDGPGKPGTKPKLCTALEAIGLPLPRDFQVKYSDDQESCTLFDLDTNPDYGSTVLEGTGQPPQLCLMMPDRDRQYHYAIINEGKELYLKLPLLRQERLGNGVLLCLFQGAIQRVDIHQKPETLHFGFKVEDQKFKKELKQENGEEFEDENGNQLEATTLEITDDYWRNPDGRRTLNIKNTADGILNILKGKTKLKEITSARFALQMIEGNELVRFTVEAPT